MADEMQQENVQSIKTKFCKHCGAKIPEDAVLCTSCGRQVEELKKAETAAPTINITQTSSNVNTNTNNVGMRGFPKPKNKWLAFLLCVFLGFIGAHKFYEGKIALGILYILTVGLFGIGWIIDTLALLFKPNPYYV